MRCLRSRILDQPSIFFSFEVAQSKQGISLYQRKYALNILADNDFIGSKPLSIPLDQHVKLDFNLGDLISDLALNEYWLVDCYI